jgi:hypothetical protein
VIAKKTPLDSSTLRENLPVLCGKMEKDHTGHRKLSVEAAKNEGVKMLFNIFPWCHHRNHHRQRPTCHKTPYRFNSVAPKVTPKLLNPGRLKSKCPEFTLSGKKKRKGEDSIILSLDVLYTTIAKCNLQKEIVVPISKENSTKKRTVNQPRKIRGIEKEKRRTLPSLNSISGCERGEGGAHPMGRS